MRKLLLTTILAMLTIAGLNAREADDITVDGRLREYVYYEPATSKNEVVIFLHGFGETYDDYDQNVIQNFADKNQCTVIMPQALPEQDQDLLAVLDLAGSFEENIKRISTQIKKSAWGANVYITIDDLCTYLDMTKDQLTALIQIYYPQYMKYITAGKLQINKDVNDRNFINTLMILFRVNANTKFHIVGFSLGGAMAYDLGFNTPENISRIATISGFVSKSGVKIPDSYNLPTLAINSLTDEVIPFAGGLFNPHIGMFFRAIAEKQGARAPKETILNKDQSEDKQIQLFDWASAPHDRFYVLNQADHYLFDDMAALGYNVFDVVGDFLFDTHTATNEATADSKKLIVYPNPVENIANVNMEGKYSVINLAGVTVSQGYTYGTIDLSAVITGRYILTVETESSVSKAMIIKK